MHLSRAPSALTTVAKICVTDEPHGHQYPPADNDGDPLVTLVIRTRQSADIAAAPPGSATTREGVPRPLCAGDGRVFDQDDAIDVVTGEPETSVSPTRRGASESAAMPPAGASTGRPASSALFSVGSQRRLDTGSRGRGRDRQQSANQLAPADSHEHGVEMGACPPAPAQRSLAEQRLALIEGVHRQRAGFRRPRFLAASASA